MFTLKVHLCMLNENKAENMNRKAAYTYQSDSTPTHVYVSLS
jgi:hypothetical protein